MDFTKLGEIALAVYGLLTVIVKICPTLNKNNIFLGIIKILGKLTNRQTDDGAIRNK